MKTVSVTAEHEQGQLDVAKPQADKQRRPGAACYWSAQRRRGGPGDKKERNETSVIIFMRSEFDREWTIDSIDTKRQKTKRWPAIGRRRIHSQTKRKKKENAEPFLCLLWQYKSICVPVPSAEKARNDVSSATTIGWRGSLMEKKADETKLRDPGRRTDSSSIIFSPWNCSYSTNLGRTSWNELSAVIRLASVRISVSISRYSIADRLRVMWNANKMKQ